MTLNAKPPSGEAVFLGRDEHSWSLVQPLWQQLFRASGSKLWRECWQWLYGENPFWTVPDSYPLVVYRSEGQFVGQLGLIPTRVRLDGKWVDAAWCIDYHILPSHQRQGIGKKLLDCALARIPLLLTLGQTDASYGLFVKAGWHGRDKHVVRSRTILRPFAAALRRLGLSGSVQASSDDVRIPRIASRFGPMRVASMKSWAGEPDLLHSQDTEPDGHGVVARTAEFLEWRYNRHPKLRYTLLKLTLCDKDQVVAYAVVRFGWTGIYRKAFLCDFIPVMSVAGVTRADLTTACAGPIAAFCKLRGAELFETEMSPQPELTGGMPGILSRTKPGLRFLYGMARMESCPDLPVSSWSLSPGDCDADLLAGMAEPDSWAR